MTVIGLIERLQQMPPQAQVVSSKQNGNDEYDVEIVPFRVAKYYKDADDEDDECVVYVGADYKHPN